MLINGDEKKLHCYVYAECMVQFMVSVLSKIFRDCEAKHLANGNRNNVLVTRISSHLCFRKDVCLLTLSSFLARYNYTNSK